MRFIRLIFYSVTVLLYFVWYSRLRHTRNWLAAVVVVTSKRIRR